MARHSVTELRRIDEALAPARLVASAVSYSLFITDDGLYAIRTGAGWRLQVRASYQNRAMAEAASRVAATLDPNNLALEVAAHDGSWFISRTEISNVVVSLPISQLPRLTFADDKRRYRFQFNEGRLKEVEAFGDALSALAIVPTPATPAPPTGPATGSGGSELLPGAPSTEGERNDGAWMLAFDGRSLKTIALPSPCWGATPYVGVVNARLFVRYQAPGANHHVDQSVVYRATDDEHGDFVSGRTALLELCQRLVNAAWGSTPPPTLNGAVSDQVVASRRLLEKAVALRQARLAEAQRDLGRGGSAEQTDRLERILRAETEQQAFERALSLLPDAHG